MVVRCISVPGTWMHGFWGHSCPVRMVPRLRRAWRSHHERRPKDHGLHRECPRPSSWLGQSSQRQLVKVNWLICPSNVTSSEIYFVARSGYLRTTSDWKVMTPFWGFQGRQIISEFLMAWHSSLCIVKYNLSTFIIVIWTVKYLYYYTFVVYWASSSWCCCCCIMPIWAPI